MKYTEDQLRDIYKGFELSACWSQEGKVKRMTKAREAYVQVDDILKGTKVFDVGAAGGFFLQAFKENGWAVSGSELSHTMIKYADKHFKISLKYGFLRDTIIKADLFIFWNTLEHLPDPAEAVRLVEKNLPKRGMVYTNIPLNDPAYPHVTVFTERSILELFKGFKCLYRDFNRGSEPQYIIQLWRKK